MQETPKRIFVVEDESIIGVHLKSSLIQLGYKVVALVTSGEEAIEKVGDLMPDLILMDIKLAGDLDGIQTAEHIRTRYALPVVYLTAHSDTYLLERAKLTDPFGYLIKPFHEKELRATIEMAIYKHQLERRLRNTNQHLEQEIHERRQVEQELQIYREHLEELVLERTTELEILMNRFRTVVETVGEGISLSDETGYFEIFNSKMGDITGYTKEEANRSSNFLHVLYPDHQDYQQTLLGLQEIRQRGGTRDIETTITTKQGEQKTLLVSTSIIHAQERIWYLSAYRDITDRKRTEIELQHAKETAELANRAKSQFIANMSHELRTPLNAILGYAQIFKTAENLTSRQIEGLETIKSSGEHLLHLINEVLDLAKVEVGKFELRPKEFQLASFLSQLVKIMRIQADQRGLSFVYEEDPDIPSYVQGDEQRLREVLINLLGNAIKFTDEGQVKFRVKVRNVVAASSIPEESQTQNPPLLMSTIRFEVEDTGIGIAPEKIEEIFLPFQQGDFQRSAKEGTGLGLTISRKFVEMMGGALQVSSRVEEGSLFAFELTFPEVVQRISPKKTPREPIIIGYQGERRTILVADDREGNRAVLVERLVSLGFDALEAENGQECLDLALKHLPHLILLDLQMPVLNGFETIRKIKTFPELRDVIVIAVSASVYDEVKAQSLEAGCHVFLSKPVHFQTLLEYLRQYLQLEWVYQTQPLKAPYEERSMKEATPVRSDLLPSSVRETLINLAKLGMARQLLSELEDLAVQDEMFLPLTDHLRHFVKNYQFEQVLECLQTPL